MIGEAHSFSGANGENCPSGFKRILKTPGCEAAALFYSFTDEVLLTKKIC